MTTPRTPSAEEIATKVADAIYPIIDSFQQENAKLKGEVERLEEGLRKLDISIIGQFKDAWEKKVASLESFAREAVSALNHCRYAIEQFKKHGMMSELNYCIEVIDSKLSSPLASEILKAADNKPDYYYSGVMTTYDKDRDPEATCWHCKKTFLCDPMDACCRMCNAPFAKDRCEEFGFKPSESTKESGGA